MWQCPQCGEELDDQFTACWNCGTQQDGTVVDDFVPEPDDPDVPDPERQTGAAEPIRSATLSDLVELVCRALALWIFVQTFAHAVGALTVVGTRVMDDGLFVASFDSMFIVLAVAVPLFILVGAIWKKSAAIARWVTPDGSLILLRAELETDRLMQVVFAAMGLWLLMSSVRELVGRALAIAVAIQFDYEFAEFWTSVHWQADLWSTLAGIALGTWLLLGFRGIVRTIRKLQRSEDNGSPTATG